LNTKKTILIVDDECSTREMIRSLLKLHGYNTIEAADSTEAINKATELIPDLILLDLYIPTIDGLEVCRILKKHKRTMSIPVIILTVRSNEIDRIVGYKAGADDYMTKPFQIGELTARIKTVLRRSSARGIEDHKAVVNQFNIDKQNNTIELNGKILKLRSKEFKLMYTMLQKSGSIASVLPISIIEALFVNRYTIPVISSFSLTLNSLYMLSRSFSLIF